jgi:Mrp family chromosome partitioning ATPase
MDMQMREYLAEELHLSQRLNQLQLHFGASNPNVVATRTDLQLLEDRIDSLLAFYQAKVDQSGNSLIPGAADGNLIRPSLAELKARESNIRAMCEKIQAETKTLGQLDLQIRKLKADRDAITKKLDETSARIDQLNLESTTANRISILTYGETPTAPLPNKRLSWAFAFSLLGLALGAGLGAFRGWTDDRVGSLLHMQHLAPALTVLGTLPTLPDDLEDAIQISDAAHCVHQIRSLLETVSSGDRGRAITITSPTAGDGKTSLTLALGLSFAASGTRTLLVDCDMISGGLTRRLNAIAHRRLGSILQRQGLLSEQQIKDALHIALDSHKKFGEVVIERGYVSDEDVRKALTHQGHSSVGLLDALDGEPLAACVTSAVRENLFILPLGDVSPDHSSQLSAKALRRLIQEARTQFDLIIFDTGPLLGSLEAAVAARETDEVILAIARGASVSLVTRIVKLLETLGAHLSGVVLNRATSQDIAYSNYGSIASYRNLRSSNQECHSPLEPRSSAGRPPHLGPVAAAVVSAGLSSARDGQHRANGSPKHAANSPSQISVKPFNSSDNDD